MENKLFYKKNFIWEKLNSNERTEVFDISDDYRKFIDASKTERLSIKEIIKRAEAKGFVNFESIKEVKPGDRLYYINKEKNAVLVVVGKEKIENGMNIVGSHVDAPRIDIKQNPLYEEHGLSLLKTHYYGGIRKYQWVTIPLAMYGTVVKANGEIVDISIGDDEKDPIFYITDLLPHLAKDQNEKKLSEAIEGEGLNVIIGSLPADCTGNDDEDGKDKKFKYNVLKILKEKYGMIEEDFQTAELEIVPAGKSRDVGIDRGMIAAYGHDDRVCAYTSLKAILEVKNTDKTAVALFVDKEEIGSVGNTGMQSMFFNNMVAELIALQNNGVYSELSLKRSLSNSSMLSSDVAAGVDPTYPQVSEIQNSPIMGKGVAMVKYTGSRGKSGANDANAEYIGKLRKLFNENNVVWQPAELGKVDQGGGGTIAYIMANYNMDVVDLGVPVLSMHAPYEIISKTDLYMTYKAYKVFYNNF
ncbi:aminopeptidase [Sedimentibacter hydroxybenzoicus DSM 7310]|uniref:M18 family aminopeptidase n=1 Tax=Sedimentibacter hydroxybenzoicus DSM 7310 TaxID=1123245 RepID=A0A974BGF2_SEDHY|nr:aminopeptidase [Sedimentibacter hydroxybenzoicus]NYB72664.1 aminopeptidase [Sedimentibacter hydroxybenzoicus DSM 7310]